MRNSRYLVATVVALFVSVAGAAEIVIRPGVDAGAEWNKHRDGDSIIVEPGSYVIQGRRDLANGAKLYSRSDNFLDTSIEFKTANNEAAINLRGSANLIKGLTLKANCGVIKSNNLNDCVITGCRFTWGYNGTYYNRLAIGGWGSARDCVVEFNLFDNSSVLNSDGRPPDDRSAEIWGFKSTKGPGSARWHGNEYWHVNDGGHIMNPESGFRWTRNVGARLRRMAVEVQQNYFNPDVAPVDMVFDDNVFYDWHGQYWDSMGMSLPIVAKQMFARRNYIRHNETLGWKTADSSGNYRGSYGMEGPNGPDFGAVFSDNVLIGERNVAAIASPSPGLDVLNNRVFGGEYNWGIFIGEPGNSVHGSISDKGGNVVQKMSRADAAAKMATFPQPPRLVTRKPYGQRDGATPPDPVAVVAPPTVTAFRTMVKVAALPGATIQKRAGAPNDAWRPVALDANGFDKSFDISPDDEVANRWAFFYRQVVNGVASAEVRAQIGIAADPTTPVPTQPTTEPTPADPFPSEIRIRYGDFDLVIPTDPETGNVGGPGRLEKRAA